MNGGNFPITLLNIINGTNYYWGIQLKSGTFTQSISIGELNSNGYYGTQH